MKPASAWNSILLNSVVATAATSATSSWLSFRETGHAAAALNATSHIVWGDAAARQDKADLRHTLVGAAINAAAMVSWASVQQLFFPRARGAISALGLGATVSGLAYVTDYYIVPRRLTPGFEKRLSPLALSGVYAALAGALGFGAWLARKR